MSFGTVISGAKKIAAFLKSRLWPTIEPLLDSGLDYALGVISDIAFDFVEQVESDPSFLHDGPAKKALVFKAVSMHPFVTNGKFATRVINLAIELALARFEAKK